MAELFNWTSQIDQQTAQRNLQASPEGQMARQRGLAELSLVQGNVQEQQMRMQAQKSKIDADRAFAKMALGQADDEANKKDNKARVPDMVSELTRNSENQMKYAKAMLLAGNKDAYDDAYAKAVKYATDAAKMKDDVLAQEQKKTAFMDKSYGDLAQAAGAVLQTRMNPGSIQQFEARRAQIRKEFQQTGIPMTPQIGIILNHPIDQNYLTYLQQSRATVGEQMRDLRQEQAAKRIPIIDEVTGLIKGYAVESSTAQKRADDALKDRRESTNGKEGKQIAIDPAALWGDGWNDLSPEDQQTFALGVGATSKQSRKIVNRAVDDKTLVKGIAEQKKKEITDMNSGIERARAALLPPGSAGAGRGSQGVVSQGYTSQQSTPEDQRAIDVAKGKAAPAQTEAEKQYDIPGGTYKTMLGYATKVAQTQMALAGKKGTEGYGAEQLLDAALRIRNGEKESEVALKVGPNAMAGVNKVSAELDKQLGPKTQYATGSIERRYSESLTRAGTESLRGVKQIIHLGTGVTSGTFSDLAAGKGVTSSVIKNIGTELTDADSQDYDTIAGYMGTEIATVANNGLKPSSEMNKKYTELFKSPAGTPPEVAMLKVLNGIDFIRNGLQSGTPANKKDEIKRRETLSELNKFPDPNDFIDALKKAGKPVRVTKDFRLELEGLVNKDSSVKNYASEQELRDAKIPDGTRVKINGVSGVWHN